MVLGDNRWLFILRSFLTRRRIGLAARLRNGKREAMERRWRKVGMERWQGKWWEVGTTGDSVYR